jgi:hypothetical protein
MRMRVFTIWRFLPVPVLVVPRLPGRLVGVCLGPAVLLREDYADDWPTVVHELEHCKQFWRGGAMLHFLRYTFSRGYRLDAELQAFRAELDACEDEQRRERLDDAARALATGYRLALDAKTCRRMLAARVSGR